MSLEPDYNFLHHLNTGHCGFFFFFFFFFIWPVRRKILHKFCQLIPSTKTKILPRPNQIFFCLVEGNWRLAGERERERESEMEHRKGLVFDVRLGFGIGMGWTSVPSIGSSGLGMSKIIAAAGKRETEERNEGFKKKKNDFFIWMM
jgi:hypothetical protein